MPPASPIQRNASVAANAANWLRRHSFRRWGAGSACIRMGGLRPLGESGQTLVEFALTIPILVVLVIGMTELCLSFYIYEAISELAREGTRYAIVHGSTCQTAVTGSCTATPASVQTYVKGLGLLNSNSLLVTATYPDGNEAPGSRAKVVVQYTAPFKIPFTPVSPITMSSTSEMYILQ